MNVAKVDMTIVGAGAAGLATAIFAAEANPHLNIMLLDGAKSIGAKIRVSGGGRCNVTNVKVVPADFHAPRQLVQRILKRFNEQRTFKWFAALGVPLKEELHGKLFPVSNSANTVLRALVRRCEELKVTLLLGHRVQDVTSVHGQYLVIHSHGSVLSSTLVLATGGQSLPRSGSDGQGWEMVQRLGHSVMPPVPALVPLVLEDSSIHASLSGVSHDVELTTRG